MIGPALYPASVFPVEHRMDGGPNRDGNGWGIFEYDPRPNVPPFDLLAEATIWHTTETPGIPGYGGGVHPHGSIVVGRNRRLVQHVRRDRRAGTLAGSSTLEGGQSVPTNRARVRQFEIIAYSADWIAAQAPATRVAVKDLDDDDLALIALIMRWEWENSENPGPLVWAPYPSAHGMPHRAWVPLDGRRAWFAADHKAAPDASTHWDSDAINRMRVIQMANGIWVPSPSLPPPEDPMHYPRRGDTGDEVLELQTALVLRGAVLVVDGDYGARTAAAVAAFQTRARRKTAAVTVDGDYASPETFAALAALPLKIKAT